MQLFVGIYRWVFGLLGLSAVAVGFHDRVLDANATFVNYFSYFTILSNVFAAALLLAGAWPWTPRRSATFDSLRGAAALYMTVTGLVYGVLLAHYPVLVPAWINDVEHRLMPVVVVADWLLAPPAFALTFARGLRWLAFPLLYVAYTELRGPIVDWYPYPFLDPRPHGYVHVIVYSIAITALFMALSAGIVWVGNRELTGREPVNRPGRP